MIRTRYAVAAALLLAPSSWAQTTRMSLGPSGIEGDAPSAQAAVCGNARCVAFASSAGNLIAADGNEFQDVFVFDRMANTTERVSVGIGGVAPDGESSNPDLDRSGRFVAFASKASNLIASDHNGKMDVFVYDRVAKVTERVSVGAGGAEADGPSGQPSISDDGRYVAFRSRAGNLAPLSNGGEPRWNVFVHDRQAHATVLASASWPQLEPGDSILPDLSGDGRFVAFECSGALLPSDGNGKTDVYLFDLASQALEIASRGGDGELIDADCTKPALSDDGSRIAFVSKAKLFPGDGNGTEDVFVRDRGTNEVMLASGLAAAEAANVPAPGFDPALSGNGRFVAFTRTRDLPGGGHTRDVFVRDLELETTTLVSNGIGGLPGSGESYGAAISDSGCRIAFASEAADLVDDDGNGVRDVFLRMINPAPGSAAAVADLAVDPSGAIHAQYVIDGALPASEPLFLYNYVGDCVSNLAWSAVATPPVSWLALSAEFGVVGAADVGQEISASFHPQGLAEGTYFTVVRFQNVLEPSDHQDVAFSLQVTRLPANLCLLSPNALVKSFVLGGAEPLPFANLIQNCGPGGSILNWTVAAEPPVPWLLNAPFSGALADGDGVAVNSTLAASGLPVGVHSTKLVFRNVDDPTDTETVDLTLKVGQSVADLCIVDGLPIGASYTIGGAAPADAVKQITNCGDLGSLLNYGVLLTSPAPWLHITPTFGALLGGERAELTFQFDVAGLAPGFHKTFVRIQNIQNPEDIEEFRVALQVNMPPADLCSDATPLASTYVIGGPAPGNLHHGVTNCGPVGSELSWGVEVVPAGTPWLFAVPKSGELAAGASENTGIIFNAAGLAPGVYKAALHFVNAVNPADDVTVPVQLTVVLPVADLCLDSALPITVAHTAGDPAPAPVIRNVTNCGQPFSTLHFDAIDQPTVSWLHITPSSGNLLAGSSQPVQIIVDPAGLAAGTHMTSVRFRNIQNPADFISVPVTVAIDLPPANLDVTPDAELTRTYVIGGPSIGDAILTVTNAGPAGSLLNWGDSTVPPVSWLVPFPLGGNLPSGASKNVRVVFNPAGLVAGEYTTELRFSNLDNAVDVENVAVKLTVIEPTPDLCLDSTAPIAINYTLGGAPPAPAARIIDNCGHPLSLLPYVVVATPNVDWLIAAPSVGTIPGVGPGDTQQVSINFVAPNLTAAGMYTTTLRFLNVNDPSDFEDVPVTVNVDMPDADLSLNNAAPIAVEYAIGGAAPPAFNRTVSNIGPVGSKLLWGISEIPNAPWLITLPLGGSLEPGQNKAVAIQFLAAGLAEGTYNTTLRFQNLGVVADFVDVPVQLVVKQPKANLAVNTAPIAVTYDIAGPIPGSVTRNVANTGDAGSTLDFAVAANPNVGWLQFDPASGQVAAGATKGVTFDFTPEGLTEGVYVTTVRFTNVADPTDFEQVLVTLTVDMPPADLCLDSSAPVSDHFDIGYAAPADIIRTVSNCGPEGSSLTWSVTTTPPAPWLFVAPTNGVLAAGETAQVVASYDLLGIVPGTYETDLVFANAADAADVEIVHVTLEVVDPAPDLCLTKGLESITFGYEIGGDLPAPMVVGVENCGNELATLLFNVTATPPVAWLTVGPSAGEVAPLAGRTDVSLEVNPLGLVDGTYTTTLRFQNSEDAADFVDLPVTLKIGNIVFIPGDRLQGGLLEFDKAHEVEFDGVNKMLLKMKVKSATKKMKVLLTLVDPSGTPVKSFTAKATKKGLKRTFKLNTSGRFKLRIEPVGVLGDFDIKTGRKLPKQAKKVTKTAIAGADLTLDVGALFLPQALMNGTVDPKGKTPAPLEVAVIDTIGASLDAGAFTTTSANGTSTVTGVPVQEKVGLFKFRLTGFTSPQQKAKVVITPTQPPKGTDTIVLP